MIRLGPNLKLHSVASGLWNISVMIAADQNDPPLTLMLDGSPIILDLLTTLPQSKLNVWRGWFKIPQQIIPKVKNYQVNNVAYQFTVPAKGQTPNIAYVSCNGFSDPKYLKASTAPYGMWTRLLELHTGQSMPQNQRFGPWHLTCYGGDQIYSDALWVECKALADWLTKTESERLKAPFTKTMQQQLDAFFEKAYISTWTKKDIASMMASSPAVMMWDDHDIFDGWGSYPPTWHDSPVYQGIFKTAQKYFLLFQQHTNMSKMIQPKAENAMADQAASSQAYVFGDMALLVLDLRSERRPQSSDGSQLSQVVSPDSWQAIYNWLNQQKNLKHLLVMSSIPVVHPGFGVVEKFMQLLPGQQSLEDDLQDQWTSTAHKQERLRLVYRLLDFAALNKTRVTILSGDVHVGAVSAIESSRTDAPINSRVINQLTSSGVVHPPPPSVVLYYLNENCKQKQVLDRGLEAVMYPFPGTDRYVIGSRNFLTLEPDLQGRLWANWWIENESLPTTKAIHPV